MVAELTESCNDLFGDLRGGSAQIDRQRVLARIGFFERVDLASQQLRGHEMTMASAKCSAIKPRPPRR